MNYPPLQQINNKTFLPPIGQHNNGFPIPPPPGLRHPYTHPQYVNGPPLQHPQTSMYTNQAPTQSGHLPQNSPISISVQPINFIPTNTSRVPYAPVHHPSDNNTTDRKAYPGMQPANGSQAKQVNDTIAPVLPPGLTPSFNSTDGRVMNGMLIHPDDRALLPSSSTLTSSNGSTVLSDNHSRSLSLASSMTSPRAKQLNEVESLNGPLDKYASTYVPSWLRAINEDPQFKLIPLPEEPNYDYDAFVSCFLPRKLVFSDPDDDLALIAEAQEKEKVERLREDSVLEQDDSDLVPVDSAWLRGDQDGLEGLEEALQDDGTDELEAAPRSAHASIGANSQAQEGDSIGSQEKTAGPVLVHNIPDSKMISPLPPFLPSSYADRFKTLLELEFLHRREVLAAQSLFDVQLSVFPEEGNPTPAWSKDHLYVLKLPGIREDYPNLVTGDLLQLRVLATNAKSWLRLAFEAKVYAVQKVAGLIVVKCDGLVDELKSLFAGVHTARFNILFTSSAFRGSSEVFAGVERVGKYLRKQEHASGKVMKRWLFPSLDDDAEGVEDMAPVENLTNWHDEKLNIEQKRVVRNITLSRRRRIPFLIHGPPGTGKTKTLVETTLQIIRHDGDSRILLTAPSVTAADTLALRLANHLTPKEMIRINDPRRTFEEVPQALLMYCSVDEARNGKDHTARFGLPEWEKLMRAKVVIMATHDIHILHLCKVSNLELGRWQGSIVSMMYQEQTPPPLHWTHLLVDEAGQSSEAELANALLLVVPSRYHDSTKAVPTVVLCGDIAQLGPQIDSHHARSHGLDVSLLERLSKRKVYHRQLTELRKQARQSLLRGDYAEDKAQGEGSSSKDTAAACAAHLVRNYRARNPSLLHVFSMLFYDDCLLPCAPPSTLKLSSWKFPNNGVPLLFEHIASKDEWVDEGASFYNSEEADRVVELCKSLTGKASFIESPSSSAFVRAKDIAVITPYREQVWRIRLQLRKAGLAAISVGNVEVYQGAEHRVTIISTVRSTSRFLEIDAKRSLGLVFERKRLCVALSRAQEALIVVGNANLLRQDPYWRSFIAYAKRNKVFQRVGKNEEKEQRDEEEEEDDGSEQVGALEYAARVSHSATTTASNGHSTSLMERETDTAFLAGRMAASALYEEEEDENDDEEGEGKEE
ncbi:hypothetical protein CBS101457_006762 [Exobasidium rhododendri]|nr:hypothetical protein CBS101457_006762 [Exobasidium rhododendri]